MNGGSPAPRRPLVDDALLTRLREVAARQCGFRPDAIAEASLRRFARQRLEEGLDRGDLIARLRQEDPELLEGLTEAVVPSPTYLFRHPEHFQYLSMAIRVGQVGLLDQPVRAWSAGCSTGEEAYSLIATLRAARPGGDPNPGEVLGTDLLPTNLARAAEGRYTTRSLRASSPLLHPVLETRAPGEFEVEPVLRRMTRFAHHNLLDPAPEADAPFDVVFCRNVFLYLTPAAIRLAWANMREMLRPGALVVFGPADLLTELSALEPVGTDDLAAFAYRPERPVAIPARAAWPGPRHPAGGVRPGPAEEPSARFRGAAAEAGARSGGAAEAGAEPSPGSTHAAEESADREAKGGVATPRRGSSVPPLDPVDPVALHVQALGFLERDELAGAHKLLASVRRVAPDYVPGLVEYALLCRRLGRTDEAHDLMERAFALTRDREADEELAGPSPLPVRYYRQVARTFLWGAALPSAGGAARD